MSTSLTHSLVGEKLRQWDWRLLLLMKQTLFLILLHWISFNRKRKNSGKRSSRRFYYSFQKEIQPDRNPIHFLPIRTVNLGKYQKLSWFPGAYHLSQTHHFNNHVHHVRILFEIKRNGTLRENYERMHSSFLYWSVTPLLCFFFFLFNPISVILGIALIAMFYSIAVGTKPKKSRRTLI